MVIKRLKQPSNHWSVFILSLNCLWVHASNMTEAFMYNHLYVQLEIIS